MLTSIELMFYLSTSNRPVYHYSRFENMGRFVTLKKSGSKYGPENSRVVDQKMVRPKKVANDQKINLAPSNFLVLFKSRLPSQSAPTILI